MYWIFAVVLYLLSWHSAAAYPTKISCEDENGYKVVVEDGGATNESLWVYFIDEPTQPSQRMYELSRAMNPSFVPTTFSGVSFQLYSDGSEETEYCTPWPYYESSLECPINLVEFFIESSSGEYEEFPVNVSGRTTFSMHPHENGLTIARIKNPNWPQTFDFVYRCGADN